MVPTNYTYKPTKKQKGEVLEGTSRALMKNLKVRSAYFGIEIFNRA